jgi:hypothetical protein
MAETIGSLVDKISIVNLKIYHMKEQISRKDVDNQHINECKVKLDILKEQRKDLEDELTDLFYNVIKGKVRLKVYRQFKMYNDPKYRIKNK